jgi:iron complex transport system substrate-binding protein
MAEPRIVSLIASATEIVAALGLGRSLVGRSHECDYPAEVVSLPVCSEPKIDVNGTSREIDARVKSLAREAISVYRVFPDVLQRLEPTHIVTQTQCEVCAVSLNDVEAAMYQVTGSHPQIVSLAPMRLADLWTDIETVGRSLAADEIARDVVENLRGRLDQVAAKAARSSDRPSIACIEWIDPLMSAGNWVPELVELAGGRLLFGKAGEHSPWMTWEQFLTADPEVIAVMPCGFDISRTRQELPAMTGHPQWSRLRAVRQGRVYLTDGNQFFNRPGPRLVESAQILAEILHPDLFGHSMEGTGWVRLAG